jgi:L-ascorbate metabolism protein UlaG (beta-lactamase superfamily)
VIHPDAVTYVGHATVLLELNGTRILTDPLLRPRFMHARRVARPVPGDLLEGLDAVLVSHLHMDHLDFRSLRGLDRGVEFIVPAGGARVVGRRGFRNVTELSPGEAAHVGPIEVSATLADHDGRRWPVGPSRDALSYLLTADRRAYFAGDTDLTDDMVELGDGIDVALLPVGGWGPRVGEGHLDWRRAAQAAAMIKPRIVVPIHWGTYQRADLAGRRPDLLSQPPQKLVAEAETLAPDVEVRVLQPGETLTLR